jgi:hypothetical protein
MVEFAKMKLSCSNPNKECAQIAALHVRIIIDFDITRELARNYEEKLVGSHMRIALAVPEHWMFMRTGSSSEPVLAEAAVQILNADRNFAWDAPRLLAKMFESRLLAKGERGELVGHLL